MELLRIIIKSLNLIEVRGAENLDRMLGCIQGLEKLDAALEVHHDDHHEQEQNVPRKVD